MRTVLIAVLIIWLVITGLASAALGVQLVLEVQRSRRGCPSPGRTRHSEPDR